VENKMKILVLISSLLLTACAFAQSQLNLNIGQNYSIKSEHLKGMRNYYIHLPVNYEASDKRYPVLYVLDGQMHFTSAVAIQNSLGKSTDVPEMIIVGIENVYPRRRDLKRSKRETFASFLADELIPVIDKTYRTKQERIIFGWEQGGYFSSYLLFHQSQLFAGAISSNGTDVNDSMIDNLKSLSAKNERYLYLANSIQDIFTIDDTSDAVKALTSNTSDKLKWKSELFNNETHASLPYLAMFNGLRYFYHNYNAYNFYSIKQYEDFGGIPKIEAYFKLRAERFGFSEEIDSSTKNTLIWLAWKRDNFKYFDFFMNEFKDVLETRRYQSEYWQNRFGQFYLKYQDYDAAIGHFKSAKDKFEKSARVLNGLGKAYQGKNETSLAIANLKEAIKVAQQDSDRNLKLYESDLEKVMQNSE
jgi:predicted alpha/beta superfamily hydrolase